MAQDIADGDRAGAAGALLRGLLRDRPAYRIRWERELRRSPRRRGANTDAPNASAVARVLAVHLWDTGERPDTETDLARRLKDRVSRALAGGVMSGRTLDWFVGAFDMAPHDAAALHAAWSGSPVSTAADRTAIAHTLRAPQYLPLRQRHRTVCVFERHILGPDGAPASHRTTRAIVASEDGVDLFPCRLPPGARDVRVLRGARITARHTFPGSTPVVELTLPVPLAAGEIASLEYEVTFAPRPTPVTEYRRVAHARAENVDIVVEFHPTRAPLRVWWALWDDHRDGTVLTETPALPAPDGSVHRFVASLEHAAAGFRWTW